MYKKCMILWDMKGIIDLRHKKFLSFVKRTVNFQHSLTGIRKCFSCWLIVPERNSVHLPQFFFYMRAQYSIHLVPPFVPSQWGWNRVSARESYKTLRLSGLSCPQPAHVLTRTHLRLDLVLTRPRDKKGSRSTYTCENIRGLLAWSWPWSCSENE